MKIIAALFIGIVIWLFLSLILAIPVMLLWNWLTPDLFQFKQIGLMQAWGLSFLCALLFKSHTSSSK